MTIIYHKNEISNWYSLLLSAESQANVSLDQELEVYLAFMMKKSVTDVAITDTIVTLNYLEALKQSQCRRIRLLRTTAEYSLILSTLFPKLAKRRNVSNTYYADMSQVAYSDLILAYRYLAPNLSDLFRKILTSFKDIMAVLISFRHLHKHLDKLKIRFACQLDYYNKGIDSCIRIN